MNYVDLIIIVLGLAAAARGWYKGLLGQLFGLGGGLLGLLVGLALGPRLATRFVDKGFGVLLVSTLIVVVFLGIGQAIGGLAGRRFGNLAKRAKLGPVDATLGAVMSVIVTLLVAWLIGTLLVSGPSTSVAGAVRDSAILDFVERKLPPPPDVLAYLREYLDTSGFPQVFVGFPRATGPPVELPAGQTAHRAAQAGDQSTFRIASFGCGATHLGSGWLASPDSVVTNAHVVAGGEEIRVRNGGNERTGQVVLFDPRTDIAVIHVTGFNEPVLRLARKDQAKGTGGATLGYPSGGPLDPERAAVQDHFDAVGRDIYGQRSVSRDLYALRATVRAGDSGGPFVLPSGRVAGVVFAASTTDTHTGYALTAAEVRDEVATGVGRTEPVRNGSCSR